MLKIGQRMPRLVVMMAAFNAQATIRYAIRSTLRAMPRDAQLVVWDDYSSDYTVEVASSIRDPRLDIKQSQKNRGSGAIRMNIADSTDSEFIACMDADDVCLPWRFTVQRGMLESADYCFGGTIEFSTKPVRFRPTMPIPLSSDQTNLALLIHNPLAHSTFIARRSAYVAAGGYSHLRLGQDYELWLRSAFKGTRIRKTATPLVLYRHSVGQVSSHMDYEARMLSAPAIHSAYINLLEQQIAVLETQPNLAGEWIETPPHRTLMTQTLSNLVNNTMSGYSKRYYSDVCATDRFIKLL